MWYDKTYTWWPNPLYYHQNLSNQRLQVWFFLDIFSVCEEKSMVNTDFLMTKIYLNLCCRYLHLLCSMRWSNAYWFFPKNKLIVSKIKKNIKLLIVKLYAHNNFTSIKQSHHDFMIWMLNLSRASNAYKITSQ